MGEHNELTQQELDSRYADKLELVFRAYEKSLDLDVALTLVPLSHEDRARIEEDPDFLARIMVCDAKVKEELMADFRNLSKNAESEGVRLTALKELGKTLYPRRFKDDSSNGDRMPRVIRYEVVEPLE